MGDRDSMDLTTTDILPEQSFQAVEHWTGAGAAQLTVQLTDGSVGKLHLTQQHSNNRFEYRWSKPGSTLDGRNFVLVRLISPLQALDQPIKWIWRLQLQRNRED
jgi:hypothetical protein